MKPKKPPVVVDRKPAFLAAYRATASVTKAAAAVDLDRRMHYEWMQDEAYAAAFAQAQRDAAQLLEDEAIRRAHEGTEEPVIYQGELCFEREDVIDDETGEVIGRKREKPLVIRKYSDSLLTFLLKAFNPNKYKDRAAVEHSGPGGGPIPIELAELTDDELAALTAIAEKLTSARNPEGGAAPAQAQ